MNRWENILPRTPWKSQAGSPSLQSISVLGSPLSAMHQLVLRAAHDIRRKSETRSLLILQRRTIFFVGPKQKRS